MAVVVHPFLKEGVQARAYQMMVLRNTLAASTLMVMPTGFGKTAVEWMAMAEALRLNVGKILLLAPTTGLVEQQQRMAQEMLQVDNESIVTYTGENPIAKRPEIWRNARIIMATAQVVRNDASNQRIDLSEVGLLIVDEAHHGTGNHAYAQVGNMYRQACEGGTAPKILGATASPGTTESSILEVIGNYDFDYLEVSRKEDQMLQPYAVEMNTVPHRLSLPEELYLLMKPLQVHFDEEVKHLQNMGFLSPTTYISGKMINEAQRRASQAIQKRDVRGYDAARRIGDLRRLHILLDLIQTQGLIAAVSFLNRAEEDGRSGERTTNRFVAKPSVHNFRTAMKDVNELHPKPSYVLELVKQQLQQHPQSKIIVFTEYRDTVDHLVGLLNSIEGAEPDRFIGQSGKGKRKGMTQKQQLAQLQRFRDGDMNILVATSVGEEGLDVPAAELVILYEPVASAIRTIQRRGRTARQQAGTVHTLIAENTRDEFVNSAAGKREERMYRLLKRIRKRGLVPSRPPASDAVFGAFRVQIESETVTVPEFIAIEKKRLLKTKPPSSVEPSNTESDTTKKRGPPVLAPAERRHSQQMGLEQFLSPPERTPIEAEHPKPDIRNHWPQPILNGETHRNQENLSAAAASAVLAEHQHTDKKAIHVVVDHREASSTLAAYLRSLGATVEFKQMKVGDIRISERILIERKTARDLVQSLTNGRLLDQCRRLAVSSSRPMLLIEVGEGHGQFVHPNAVHGVLAHISLDLGIPVMMTKSPEETAHFVVAAAKREYDMIEKMASLASERAEQHNDERSIERAVSAALAEIRAIEMNNDTQTPLASRWTEHNAQVSIEVLSAIPGIGHKKAESIIKTFSTLSNVFSASVEQLSQCEHIGAANALTVFETLHE